MHRSSTTQSSVRMSQAKATSVTDKQPIHPVLQRALASLDTQLEEELLRYRRQKAIGKATYAPRSFAQRQVKTAIDLMPVDSTSTTLQETSAAKVFHPTATVSPLVEISPTVTADSSAPTQSELRELAKQYASDVAATSDAAVVGSPDDYLESSEELLRTLSQEQAEVEAEQGFMQSLLTPWGMGSMLLLLMSSALFGFVIMNPNSVSQLFNRSQPVSSDNRPNQPSPFPDEASAVGPQPNLATQEFPDLALGNLGSIPVESSGVGMASGLPQPSTIAKPNQKTTNLGATGMATIPGSVPTLPSAPQVNNSESEPAPPVGDVPSPRKLSPAPSYAPPPARDYTPPARAYTPPARSYTPPPARAYTPPARSYSPPPIKPYTPPAKPVSPPKVNSTPTGDRTPLPPAPSPAASASPVSQPSGYKVVTPYTSDRALEEYRGKVPDAYVKNYSDGAKVQFGAYQDETSAKSQAEELRKQGIPAEVYKP